MYEQKYQTNKKNSYNKTKAEAKKKNRNKIDDEFVHNKTNIAESHKTRRAVVKINLQPFLKYMTHWWN